MHFVMLRRPSITQSCLPRTHKVIGGHLNPQSFAEYSGHQCHGVNYFVIGVGPKRFGS